MDAKPSPARNMDEYIALFPQDIQDILTKIRAVIHEAAPGAQEAIRYQMPAFLLNGPLCYFAAFKNHIGFYPIPTGIEKFKEELSVYHQGKGSVQFPLSQPIPYDLIARMVTFRAEENRTAAENKKKKKPASR